MINCNINNIILITLIVLISLVLLSSRSSENFEVTNRHSRYNNTLEMKRSSNEIINFVIKKIDDNLEYINHEDILEKIYENGVVRYIANVFLLNKKNHVTLNVIIDVARNENNIKLLSIIKGNSSNLYKENPVSTGNVVKYENDCLQALPFGETSLDFSKLDGINLPNIDYKYTDDIRHNQLREEQKNQPSQFPCRRLSKWWDKDGVKKAEKHTKCCQGINSATLDRELLASFNPNIIDKRIKIYEKLSATEAKCLQDIN